MNLRLALLVSNMHTAETFFEKDGEIYSIAVSVEKKNYESLMPLVFSYMVNGQKSPYEHFSIESAEDYLKGCDLSLDQWKPVRRRETTNE